jgi:hypothetical protein
MSESAIEAGCELCGDQGPLFLHPKCHLTAPLRAVLDGNVLTLRCYLPECDKDVARFVVDRLEAGPGLLKALIELTELIEAVASESISVIDRNFIEEGLARIKPHAAINKAGGKQ